MEDNVRGHAQEEAFSEEAPSERVVVVIDDDPIIRKLLPRLIEFHSSIRSDLLRVFCYERSDTALEALKRSKAHLLFVDMMGKHIYPFSDFRALLEQTLNKDTPVVAMSGGFTSFDDPGAVDFLAKPFDPNHFQKILDTYLKDL